MRHKRILLPLFLLLLLTACGGLEGQKDLSSGDAPSGASIGSSPSSKPAAATPMPSHDLSVAPAEEDLTGLLKDGYKEIYWTASDDFGPKGDVTVYDMEPLEDEDVDLLHDEILWNTLLPGVPFDSAERTSLGEYDITATIDGQSCSGTIGNGSFDFYLLSEIPDSLAPERVLEKLPDLYGMAFRLDEKNNMEDVLYQGVVDGLPVDGTGYIGADDRYYAGPRLAYYNSGMYLSGDFKLGAPAEVIPAESLLAPEMVKKLALAFFQQSLNAGGNPYIEILDRAEFGYYLTEQLQLRPCYLITGNHYFLGTIGRFDTEERLGYGPSIFLIDAETGEVVHRQ